MMRQYRMTPEGEKPVFASKRTLERMAREDAARHHLAGDPVIKVGNLVYDAAYQKERERLRGEP